MLGLCLYQSLELKQTIRLTLEQKLALQEYLFSRQVELVGSLRDEQYKPDGICPQCNRKMSAGEILRGFNTNPTDFTTSCPDCKRRFAPRLICLRYGSKIELPFYCPDQTLHQLQGKENLDPKKLSQMHPAIYRSMIMHYGSVRKAFMRIGIHYPFKEVFDWRSKITPFLGKLPDTSIANCLNVSVASIRFLRRKLSVPRYRARDVLEYIEK